MYTFWLVSGMLLLVLSPIALDLLLSWHESRQRTGSHSPAKRKDPHFVWASSRWK